jgi:hypothetical protein
MIDPRDKAAECERAMKDSIEPDLNMLLANLRKLWLALAEEKSMGIHDWHVEAEAIDKLHTDVLRSTQLAISAASSLESDADAVGAARRVH